MLGGRERKKEESGKPYKAREPLLPPRLGAILPVIQSDIYNQQEDIVHRYIIALLFGAALYSTGSHAAEAPAYKVDDSFDGAAKTGIVYMDVLPDEAVCSLDSAGKVSIFDPSGKELGSFTPEIEGKPAAVAADRQGRIYIFSTVQEMRELTRRGKTYKRPTPVAANCVVYSRDGKKERDQLLQDVKQVRSARIINGRIAVADPTQRAVVMIDMESGKPAARADAGIRICCGIFDFCAGPDNSIMVANLGAFKIQSYSSDGKPAQSFGKRGKELNDFHGCCNPVSVAALPGGAMITAEKSPTRVKIYNVDGSSAKRIAGIDELVKGCSHIPMVADSKGNVYLASRNKGVIKCTSAE